MPMSKANVLKRSKGFFGRASNCIKIARMRVEKGLQKQILSRKYLQRDLRKSWIHMIGAGSRQYGINYSELICSMKKEQIILNRKMMADLSTNEPYSFRSLVEHIRLSQSIPRIAKPYLGHIASVVITTPPVKKPITLPKKKIKPILARSTHIVNLPPGFRIIPFVKPAPSPLSASSSSPSSTASISNANA
eukprot:TRINITY_DN9190_c0_g1_i1.p1 TRINITY_DN9190_c0_g1~~TRINITY_DN9190_c0_g1_i1.p1  ORF type:complete len:191 (+),score=38.85 TRINITY_DN9190_c0_g1_i1:169-741(+)